MKIESDKEKLGKAIFRAEKVTGKNMTMPVLRCVLFEVKNNNLKIRATNLDLGIEIDIPVKVVKEGVVAVPGDVISSFLSNISGGSVTLEVKGNNLTVESKNNKASINTFPHDDFPVLSSVSGKQTVLMSAQELVKGLRSVWYAASPSSIKPELSSVFVHNDDNMTVFAATDSFRLAEKKISPKKNNNFDSMLIPLKNIGEIIRNFEETDDEVEVRVEKNQASISAGNTYITTRIIEGVFPDYKQIIPKESNTDAVVLKEVMIDALKVSNIFSDRFNQINLKVNTSKNTLAIETSNTEVGESTTTLQSKTDGENIEIHFNYKYIMDSFQSIFTDSLSLSFSGKGKPVVIRGVNDASFMYLVMPMNK